MMNVFYAFCAGAFGAMLGGSAAFALTGVFCAISMAALFAGAQMQPSCIPPWPSGR